MLNGSNRSCRLSWEVFVCWVVTFIGDIATFSLIVQVATLTTLLWVADVKVCAPHLFFFLFSRLSFTEGIVWRATGALRWQLSVNGRHGMSQSEADCDRGVERRLFNKVLFRHVQFVGILSAEEPAEGVGWGGRRKYPIEERRPDVKTNV